MQYGGTSQTTVSQPNPGPQTPAPNAYQVLNHETFDTKTNSPRALHFTSHERRRHGRGEQGSPVVRRSRTGEWVCTIEVRLTRQL